ncbi:MAG TPA: glycosyltransferase family 39 protein [Thermomicrobiales bacterium]|nr:glycosyltransferase family 39 protein [Thermomicrobiales bacterium]
MRERLSLQAAPFDRWLTVLVGRSEPSRTAERVSPLVLAGLVGIVTVWRLAILAYSYILDQVGYMTCGALVPQPWNYSACWDTASYQQIAANGYAYTPDEPSTIAFFPMYALLMRWANDLIPGPGDVKAGVIVNFVALIVGVVYVFLLVRRDFSETIAWRTVGFLLLFPSAFFFSAAYSEAIFLVSVAGSLYHARRGHWVRAGLFAAFGSATKLAGILLIVPLVVEALSQRAWTRPRPNSLAGILLAPLGAIAYFAWLHVEYGSYRTFFNAQQNWIRESFSPVFVMGIQRLTGDISDAILFYPPTITPIPGVWILIDTTLVALFLAAGVYLWLRVRASYGALVIAPSLLFGLSGNPQSLNRYLLVLFPVYILLAQIRSEAIRIAIIIAFGLGLGIEAFFFMNEMWAG